jgi:hypothetical protein
MSFNYLDTKGRWLFAYAHLVLSVALTIQLTSVSANNDLHHRHINHRHSSVLKYCDANPAMKDFNRTQILELENNEWREWDATVLKRMMHVARKFARGNDYYLKKWFDSDFATPANDCANGIPFASEAMDFLAFPPNAVLPCPMPLKQFGDDKDTGKMICEAERQFKVENCTIFSLGSNNQFDFEVSILSEYSNCVIRTFDCTSQPPKANIRNLEFEKTFLGARDEVVDGRQYHILATLMKRHHVENIQLFKMDIEGYEMEVIL